VWLPFSEMIGEFVKDQVNVEKFAARIINNGELDESLKQLNQSVDAIDACLRAKVRFLVKHGLRMTFLFLY